MKKILITLAASLFMTACASTAPKYNPQQFTTENYRPNLANALEYADNFIDFDKDKIPQASLRDNDFSLLLKADILFNQGDYNSAADSYYYLANKYNDPRLIYKAIICIEHELNAPDQFGKLDQMINLLMVKAPDSQVSKIFAIRVNLENNNLEQAKHNLSEIMDKNPSKARAILLLVTTILSGDTDKSALVSLSEFGNYVAEEYKEYPEAHLLDVVANSISSDQDDLITNLDYIHKNYIGWEIPTYWMAGIMIKNEDYALLNKVLQHEIDNFKPITPGIQNLYVASLLTSAKLPQAHSYIESLQISQPKDVNVLINSAIINYKLGEYPDAIKSLTAAQANGSNLNGAVDLALAALYNIGNNYESALTHYRSAQTLNPVFTTVANLGILRIYVDQKNYAAADQYIDNMTTMTKSNPHDVALIKIAIYSQLGAYDHAYTIADQKIKLYGYDKQFVYAYASLSALTNRNQQAVKMYHKYIKMNPTDATGYNDLGFLLADKTSHYLEAYKYAFRAYQMSPNDPAVLDTIGWANFKLKQNAKAEEFIEKAYHQTQDYVTANHLRQVYLAEGKTESANSVVLITPQIQKIQDEQTLLSQVMQILMYYQFGMDFNK